jgi:uncharacterized protein (TIGR03086 family)
MSEVLARYEAAVDAFDAVVHQVPDDRWTAATPCTEWDVRTLLNHVVGEQLWVVPLIDGRTVADVGSELDGDLVGDDPDGAWHHAASAAHRSLMQPGAVDRTVHLSYGDETAANYVEQLTFDALIHAWDLARGAGADDRLPDGLVAWGLAWVTPVAELYASGGAFAAPVDVAGEASQQTRLLAMTGRRT